MEYVHITNSKQRKHPMPAGPSFGTGPERQMRKFKSLGQAQRFLTVHGLVQNRFRVGRHLLQARHHRELRGRAFIAWREVTCA